MPVKWKVTQVVDGTGPDSTGRFVVGKTITFQLDTGHTGTVFVPATDANPDAVKLAVQQAAANLDAIANLTSDS